MPETTSREHLSDAASLVLDAFSSIRQAAALLPKPGKEETAGAATGGPTDERSDMVAIAPIREETRSEIRTPADVPESYLRALVRSWNAEDRAEEARIALESAARDWSGFDSEEENQAVIERAEALRATDRKTDPREFVELYALDSVIRNLMSNLDRDQRVFRRLGWDDVGVTYNENSTIMETVTIATIFDERWPYDSNYEETADFLLAHAESCALVSRIFALLAAEDGREMILECAARFASIAEDYAIDAHAALGAQSPQAAA